MLDRPPARTAFNRHVISMATRHMRRETVAQPSWTGTVNYGIVPLSLVLLSLVLL
jgi:hypothetical protein